MLLYINISLVTNNKINYGSLFTLAALLVIVTLIGAHLWMSGLELMQGAGATRKVGGSLLLAIACFCILGALWFSYWEYTQLIELI